MLQNSDRAGAIRSTARSPIDTAYASRARRPAGIVFGSVIMKKRKTRISGEETSVHQNAAPLSGPRCQRALIAWPVAASTPRPTANDTQKATAIPSRPRRARITSPPATMMQSASTIHADSGAHQKKSGSARLEPRTRKQRTSPKFDGLNTCRPLMRITCFESSETAAVPAKIHQPCVLHQSPWRVAGTRRTKATPLPVSIALAGHMITRCCRNAIDISSTAQVPSEIRIWAIDRLNPKATWPSTWSEMITAARCSRASDSFGSSTGYGVPRIVSVGPPEAGAAIAAT